MSLELVNVKKSYREPNGDELPVLDIPKFSLQAEEQASLVGSSGGGKTTLLNIIAGITTPDSGSVVVSGTDITKLPEAARDRFRAERIGFVFQTFNLLPAFSALENVLLGMSFSRGKVDRAHARELLGEMGLSQRLSHLPGQLSVGEQQRVAIARAIANRPQLLLADEPTASVDPTNKQTVLDLISKVCADHKISLLVVTHDPEIAGRFPRTVPIAEINTVMQPA
ncbi:ABC transporter ATP-binding protein [Rubinisphaera sp. JC750]|uniref:ABC transporter ATP-binding protein n=1 Tax=Rubinisphaera sp. JC750 TaxID=2898658 RepID=UPI001F2AA3E7|nr:ABC transporter ATP-binding protein [Rubinisphaera sp. JC750]